MGETVDHAEQTDHTNPEYGRNQAYYQALQDYYQTMREHHRILMKHHQILMDHYRMVEALYQEVVDCEPGKHDHYSAWQNYRRAFHRHHQMTEEHHKMLEDDRRIRKERPHFQEPEELPLASLVVRAFSCCCALPSCYNRVNSSYLCYNWTNTSTKRESV